MPRSFQVILFLAKTAIFLAPSFLSLATVRDSSIELIENSGNGQRGHLSIGMGSSYVTDIKAKGSLQSLSLTRHIPRPRQQETRYRLGANLAQTGPAKTVAAGVGIVQFLTPFLHSPFLGAEFGIGYANTADSYDLGGFIGSILLGARLYKGHPKQFEISLRAETFFVDSDIGRPKSYAAQAALLF